MRSCKLPFLCACLAWRLGQSAPAGDLNVLSISTTNALVWNNVFSNAITTVEGSPTVPGTWTPLQSFYDKGTNDHATLPRPSSNQFYRLLQVDISGTPTGYTNFLQSYGLLST